MGDLTVEDRFHIFIGFYPQTSNRTANITRRCHIRADALDIMTGIVGEKARPCVAMEGKFRSSSITIGGCCFSGSHFLSLNVGLLSLDFSLLGLDFGLLGLDLGLPSLGFACQSP